MLAQKQTAEIKKCKLELITCEDVKRTKRRNFFSRLIGFFMAEKSDLTLESWEALEAKPRAARIRAYEHPRDKYHQQMRWHL